MSYSVQFIGLACFFKEQGGRRALLPDGRNPKGVTKHIPTISVATGTVSSTNWPANEKREHLGQVEFLLSPCTISIQGADQPGTLAVAGTHDSKLPNLSKTTNNFTIDPKKALAEIPIRQGKLRPFLFPGMDDSGDTAVISQLDVQHNGPITITVTSKEGKPVRTITLNAGTEIAIVNASRHAVADEEVGDDNHFTLYGELSKTKPTFKPLSKGPTGLPVSQSHHPAFAAVTEVGTSARCSNTGCC